MNKTQETQETQERKRVFITFGGPTQNYHNRVHQLCFQASINPFFTNILGYTEQDLKEDVSFWKKHGEFIESNPRGYGYWLWKPYIIQRTLQQLEINDILVYADAGCHLNWTESSLKHLQEYITMIDSSEYGILSFQLQPHKEFEYTKEETIQTVLNDLNEKEKETIKESGQCIATTVILRKNSHTIGLIQEWLNYAEIYSLINDEKNIHLQHRQFKDHRHDQSIFSLLVKKRGSVKIPDETFFYPNWMEKGENYPIWATRQRG
jgi:hypothetical protein